MCSLTARAVVQSSTLPSRPLYSPPKIHVCQLETRPSSPPGPPFSVIPWKSLFGAALSMVVDDFNDRSSHLELLKTFKTEKLLNKNLQTEIKAIFWLARLIFRNSHNGFAFKCTFVKHFLKSDLRKSNIQ